MIGKKLTMQQAADLKEASENIMDMASEAAVRIADKKLRQAVVAELENGTAEIRQITKLVPGLMTNKLIVKLTSGKELLLFGVSF